jgi:hypothetical protein
MTTVLEQYWNEVTAKLGRLPVWLPGTPMNLGDVGRLGEKGWEKATDLRSMGIKFSSEAGGSGTSYSYSSAGGVEITPRLEAQASPEFTGIANGNAALGIKFSRAAACVLMADAVEVRRVANLDLVDQAVLDAYRRKSWKRDWVFVSEVAIGGPVLSIVAATAQGEATIDLGAGVQPGGTPLGRVHAGLRFGFTKDVAASFATTKESAVMWRGHYVHDPLFRKAGLVEKGPASDDQPSGAPIWVGEVEYLSDALPDDTQS